MKLYVKNMVSIAGKMVLKSVLEKLKLDYVHIELGEVEFDQKPSPEKLEKLKAALCKFGFELMEDERAITVERIKCVIIEMIHYEDELPKVKKSIYISEKLNCDYAHLAKLFSEVKGITIEHYIILQKIEKAKELIAYGELTLSEIADKLHYSSAAHLTNQFKNITGLTPSFFKSLKDKKLIPIETL